MLSVRRILLLGLAAAALAVATGGRVSATDDGQQGPAVAGQTPASQGQPGPGGRGRGGPGEVRAWWKDADMAREVGLTPPQIAKIDRIYEQRQAQIKPRVDEYNVLRSELDRLIRERTVKPGEIETQTRRLMYSWIDIYVSRTRMLYEMSLVMTADQNNKMRAMFDRMDRERREAIERYERERRHGRDRGGNFQRP